MKLNPILKDFWKTRKPIKVLYGGRMSSKSYDTAGVLLYMASKYKVRILCIRRYQNKLSESVYALLKEIIENEEYFKTRFTILKSAIRCDVTGSEFVFFGLHNSIEEVVGLQGIDITWVEEAHSIKENEWNRLRPTILRKGGGGFVVLVFNPQLSTDFVYKNFIMKKRNDTLIKKINYTDNPFLSQGAKDLIVADKEDLEEDTFNHIYLGHPKTDDEEAIIKRSWIEACIDSHIVLGIEPTGKRRIGYDIADGGVDTCATINTHGILAYDLDEWKAKEDELEDSAEKVFKKAKKENAEVNYDSVGVGASAGSTFKRLNTDERIKVKYSKFNAGAKVNNPDKQYKDTKVLNKDMFANLKAQAWWELADRIKETYNAVTKGKKVDPDYIISISSTLPKIEQLKEELTTPRKDEDKTGKVMVESKKDLKKRDIPSPNLADAFVMAYATGQRQGFNSSFFS